MMRGRLCFTLSLFICLLVAETGAAQQAPTISPSAASANDGANPLPGLPRIADEPASLYAPPPPPGPPAAPVPGPYFVDDPLLNPPEWGTIGWFAGVETEIVNPHFISMLGDTVLVGGVTPTTVSLPSAPLDWTAAPKFDVGYRLPSGFGDVYLSYRFFVTQGSEGVAGPDGPADLRSRLDLNVIDLDYASREITILPGWLMRWSLGVRYMNMYFDSQEIEPFAEAAAGSGIFADGESNSYWGIGPDWGLELAKRLGDTGLSIDSRVNGAILLGRIVQSYFADSTTPAGGGSFLGGQDRFSSSQAVPMFDAQLGLSWKKDPCAPLTFFVGYDYEHWWNVGRESSIGTYGHMFDQGVILRVEYNF
jgi:Legionella pneumophila major outer membrane protein precursor